MTKPGCWVIPFLLILLGAVGALALLPQRAGQCAFDDAYRTREALEAQRLENQVHAEATKTALDLQSYADRQGVKTAALQVGTVVILFCVAILALGIPGVVVWWLWVRSQAVYPRAGMYPLMVRPARRMQAYNPNLLSADPSTTARAQAVQLAAALRGDLAPGERRLAMHDLGAVFIEQQAAPRLPEMRVMDDAAISALLESGADDEPE
jgi:hypothetical protein